MQTVFTVGEWLLTFHVWEEMERFGCSNGDVKQAAYLKWCAAQYCDGGMDLRALAEGQGHSDGCTPAWVRTERGKLVASGRFTAQQIDDMTVTEFATALKGKAEPPKGKGHVPTDKVRNVLLMINQGISPQKIHERTDMAVKTINSHKAKMRSGEYIGFKLEVD